MAADPAEEQLLSVAEAAKTLGVSVPTVKRWLKDGRLAAYHLGPRYIRIRRSDLSQVVTPIQRKEPSAGGEHDRGGGAIRTDLTVRPMTDEDLAQLDDAIRRSEESIESIRIRRKRQPLAPSWPLLREIREERARRYE